MNSLKMSRSPLVSIITPSYNQGKFIEATINSVLEQTYNNIEYIILDAMSNDETEDILNRYVEKVSKIIREPDEGQSDAIIKGFRLAKGELVGWINSDDILHPTCVEKIVNAYNHEPSAVLFYSTEIDMLNEHGQVCRTFVAPTLGYAHLLRIDNTLIQPSSFYSTAAVRSVNYFDGGLKYSMDLDLWLRLLKVGRAVDIGQGPLAGYREWAGTKTSTGSIPLLLERRKMLMSHGAKGSDKSILDIYKEIGKCYLKRVPLVSNLRDVVGNFVRLLKLLAYYGFASHLPASSTRFTKWCRSIRYVVCRGLFRGAGVNINIEHGAFFGTGKFITIGNNSGIGVACKLLGDVTIGNNVMMGPEVTIVTTTHGHARVDIPMIQQVFSVERPVVIKDDVWIGTRCIILPGVTIGKGVIIGAGSVVTKSVPDFVTVGGNPARIIGQRR